MGDITLYEGDRELNVVLTPLPPPVANLYGKVTDAETGLPLSSVKVTIDGLTTYTDANGNYGFEGLTPGTYTVTFEKDGYETETR
jgi:cytoskeletal protein RodZ